MTTFDSRFTEADQLYANAIAILHNGDVAKAAGLFSAITVKFPDHGKAWNELGNILFNHLNSPKKQPNVFRKPWKQIPALPAAYLGYAEVLFVLERYAEANAIVNQAMEVKGVRKDLAWMRSALIMESQSRFDEAIETYKKAILASFSEEDISRCEKGISRCNIKKKYQ
jgi:tetratricopeptide (TPR) repeat protein